MEILIFERNDGKVPVTIIEIHGDVDTMTFSELEKKGEEIYKQGARRIILDLSDARHISSAGLRAIHTIFNLLRSDYPPESDKALGERLADKNFRSNVLKLVKPNENVRQILTTSGYDRFLELHDDLDHAVQSFVP
ncbi:STAS domain-containing protein [bacterium]|nr:STAS domain-containing protein [bacterium]